MIAKRKFKSPACEAIPLETMCDFNQACIDCEDELQPAEITAYSRRSLSK